MKTLRLFFSFLFISSFTIAQEYQPISIASGFNADVIANGVGAVMSSTNNSIDLNLYSLFSKDFKLTAISTPLTYGLPENGFITSVIASTDGLTYQLASYSGNNSLRLDNTVTSGTLTLALPMPANTLYMLATSGDNPSTVSVTVNFSDNTSQTFSNITISDWFEGPDYAIRGFGRINRNTGLIDYNTNNPRLYQIPLVLQTTNQNKNIISVKITKIGTGSPIANIFAFSADVYNACQGPKDIIVSATGNSASLSWTAPTNAPSSGYQYYYTTSSTVPTDTTTPSGNVSAGQTSVLLNNLTTGQIYYFWVRSNCGSTKGYWKLKQFNTAYVLPDANGRVYVNKNVASSTESGSSWANATKNLQDVIDAANTNTNIKEIWVAKGTYYPSNTSNRDDFFYITRNNLKIYGGFSGTETAFSQRDIVENETILSGDIGTAGSASDNSYHIMVIDALNASIDNSTQIDGFTFQDGNGNSGQSFGVIPRYTGSAIYVFSSSYNNTPTIANNIFKNNSHFQSGALGIESQVTGGNKVKVQNCSFFGNHSQYAGGALSLFNWLQLPQSVEITDCLFENNSVDNYSQGGTSGGIGAAIYASGGGEIVINKSRFVDNKIGNQLYAGTYKGTAIAARGASKITLVNSLIYSDLNYIPLFNNGSTFNIINSTVYNPDGATILATVNPVLNSIQNSILWMGGDSVNTIDGAGTTVVANNSIILPKYNVTLTGSNNYTTDPLFKDMAGKDFTLQASSNGINKGNNSLYDASKYGNFDLSNKNRIEETTIDIGAFELQPTLSVSDINQNKSIKVYPNPVKDILNISSDSKIKKVIVIDLSGKKVFENTIDTNKKLDVQSLSKGIYLIQVFTENETKTLKFIKH